MDEELLLKALREAPHQAHPFFELLKRAGVPTKKIKEAKRTLKDLVRKGVVEREPGRRFRISRAGRRLEGQVEIDPRGSHWVVPDGPRKKVTPVRLLPENEGHVAENDRVLCQIVVRGRGNHFAELIEIVDRKKPRHLGIFRRQGNATFVELETPPGSPYRSRRPARDLLILPADSMGAEEGQLVEVELRHRNKEKAEAPLGIVRAVLGKPGDRTAEMKRLYIEHDLPEQFPPAVETDAQAFGPEPKEEDLRGRKDLRQLPLCTIDGETAKDFDDAVCVQKRGDGFVLHVAIADVSHYVREGSPLDQEAIRRGTSTYLTDRAIPMLPEALSNGLCSLKPHVDRLCMVAELELDHTARVLKQSFYPAVMRSRARLTYTRVAKALEGEPDAECQALLPTLLLLAKVASKLLERRLKRGAIDLDLPEPYIDFDEKGEPKDALRRPRNDAHRLIEDLMLSANEAVASYFVERKLPGMFRIHENPDPDKLALFAGLCASLGIKVELSSHPTPGEVARLLEEVSLHPQGKALHFLLLRSLAQARYSADCRGHYGLATPTYLHFTSPIRRYPDLIVHRLMRRLLANEDTGYTHARLQEVAERCSANERRAMLAERESMDLDRCLIARRHVGEVFPGRITGVQDFGMFIAIDAPFVEGMVHVQQLPEDRWALDEYGARLAGEHTGRSYALGDQVHVEIVAVNVARRQVELRLAELPREDGSAAPPRTERAPMMIDRGKKPKNKHDGAGMPGRGKNKGKHKKRKR